MVDFNKFVKYSKPGPRYTSYPTAIEFGTEYSYEEYIGSLEESNSKNRPLSIYIHLPFCRSACYFCGCNVLYTSKEENKDKYIDYLEKELKILSCHLDTKREVSQFHFGGGTPTFFSAEQLDRIIKLFRSYFTNFADDAEISCEIDPRFFNEEQMKVLKVGGFNRLSFGAQDFDEKVQVATHRIQSLEVSSDAVNLARKYEMDSVNIDLIYGLPYQTFDSFKDTLEKTVSMDPNRLAIFNYAHVPWLMKTMRKIDETTLPTPDVKLEIMKYAIDYLQSHGYKMIGMDHFAKPDDSLFKAIESGEIHRNFQGYTTKGGSDLIGVGITSIGEGFDWYGQNLKKLKEYESAIDSGKLPFEKGIKLNQDDLIRKRVIMYMMANFELEFTMIEEEFNISFQEYFKEGIESLSEFVQEELISIDDKKIVVSETGKLLIRNIVMVFDPYLKKIPENQRKFSKTL
ncbi:MAG: oxygen-independent coproporphyrinogen III oxidase [Campylobacterales bacterium]|nr:oxygen-independent coproporphyrinogen III oxidase [Campylobacterales bacterium]